MMLERKQREEQQKAESQQKIETSQNTQNASSTPFLKKGDRVFHSKFGVGNISDVQEIGSSTMYIVDFGSQGKKALDAAFAQLKKF